MQLDLSGRALRGRSEQLSPRVTMGPTGYVAVAVFLALAAPVEVVGQSRDLGYLTANGLLGGVAAGLAQGLRGGSFADGFKRGVVGGAIHYAGKRLMSADVPAALFLGRQVSAVGGSIVLNAGEGRGSLERVLFPLGPFALDLHQVEGRLSLTPSVSLYDVVKVVQGIANSDRRLDWGETLRAGTIVFGSRGNKLFAEGLNGATDGSVIELDDGLPPDARARVLRHEMVHVAQRGFLNRVWFVPLEDALFRRLADKPSAIRLEFLYPMLRQGLAALDIYESEVPLLESEAEWIEGRY